MRVVLVQCTSAKRDDRAQAGNIYDESDYFVKQRAYAKAHGDEWFVQSAEHGLLQPTTRIDPYDTRPSDLSDVDQWGENIADDLVRRVPDVEIVEVLGGKKYADPLTPALERRGLEVLEPLRGQRIGERKRSLAEGVQKTLGGSA